MPSLPSYPHPRHRTGVLRLRLLEKESSGLKWLLRNRRKEDLARMCVLFAHAMGMYARYVACCVS